LTQDDQIEHRIAFARFINEHILQHIGQLDTKTAIIIAINGAILALLFRSNGNPISHELSYLFYSVVILLGASAVLGLLTIIPMSFKDKDTKSIISQESIIKDYGTFFKELNSTNVQRILDEEARHAYKLARAQHWQVSCVRWSLGFLIAGIILLVVLLCLQQAVVLKVFSF